MDAVEAFARVQSQGILPEVIQRIEETFAPLIADYVQDRGKGREPAESKALKDAIWGMIDITGPEAVILDSPPMQRLRRVRQLGFSYLTYPTAGYSRFEHSLGALHQSERMVTAIARRSKPGIQGAVRDSLRVVRLAALLHDCGHMPGSHVSERFFEEEECADSELLAHANRIRSDVARAFKASPNVRLGECLSVCLVASPSFHDLLHNEARYEPAEIATAALAIAGKASEPATQFLSQLISNAIDADKLDYMFRDSTFTRVPLAIDLERLLYKLKCEEVDATDLPPAASRGMPSGSKPRVLATDVAGDRLAYDVSEAREMLYSRVYFHHKTRAAERIALEILRASGMRPEGLLAFDDDFFSNHALAQAEPLPHLARKLIWRRLPRRAFSISDYFLDPPAEERRVQWADLDDALSDPVNRQQLGSAIKDECTVLGETLKMSPVEAVLVDTRAHHVAPGGSSLLVSRPDNTFVAGQGYAPDAAAETQDPTDASYVFFTSGATEPELVYIATERVLARSFDLFFTRDTADHAKVDFEKVVERKRELEDHDPSVFREFGRLRARPAAVEDASFAGRIDALAQRFHHYTTRPEIRMTDERIREFLGQFPEALVEPAIEALEKVEFLNRDTLGAKFADQLLELAPDNTIFVPLTSGYAKSAAHIPYFLSDRSGPLDIRSLADALKTDRPVVVFDDVLVSGTQSMKILNTWFGGQDPPYKDEPVLSEDERRSLQERDVSFHFAWAWESGIQRLVGLAAEVGVSEAVRGMVTDSSGPALDGVSQSAELRKFMQEVGTDLLLSTKGSRETNPWDGNKCEKDALGYNGDERLVVIEYNTPTGTITPLWSSGTFRNAPWIPLFPRRLRGDPVPGVEGTAVAGEG